MRKMFSYGMFETALLKVKFMQAKRPIMNIYNYILSIFRRTEIKNGSQHSSYTPPRAQSRAGTTKDYKFANVPDRVREYPQRLPSRLPKSFPLIRNPSQIELLGSTANKGGAENAAFDVRRKDSVIDLRAIPFNRRSNSTFDFHSASEESLYMPSNDIGDLEECLTLRKTRSGKNSHSFTGTPSSRPSSNLRNIDARLRRFNSVPDNRRLPESCPPVTASSHISLSGSNKYTPLKTKGIARARGSSTDFQNLMLDNSLDFNILESSNTNTRREDSSRDFRHIPAQKGARSSAEFHSVARTELDGTQLNDLSECEAFTMRQLRLRNNPHSTPGSLPYKRVYSKIPISIEGMRTKEFSQKPAEFMNFPERHRSKYTLSSTKKYKYAMPGLQEKGDKTDTADLKFDGINNWITFRIAISEKFEHVFKSLSKKKHRSTGNIMDANLHVYWMSVSGISADKDANMFRSFAGGKVVLTFAEYKFLLQKICTAYDLDYWDVLQKMANFQGEEFYDEEQIFFV